MPIGWIRDPRLVKNRAFLIAAVFAIAIFVLVFRIRDNKKPPSHPVELPHEEGALRGKPSHASCHAVWFGEKVASKCVVVCAHQLDPHRRTSPIRYPAHNSFLTESAVRPPIRP